MKKYLLFTLILVFMIAIISLVSSYSVPSINSANFTLCPNYTPPPINSANFTLGDTYSCGTPANSCTYSSGNWNISLADYCVISSPVNLGINNITFYGTGNVTFNSTITTCNVGGLPANQIGYLGSNALIKYGVCV